MVGSVKRAKVSNAAVGAVDDVDQPGTSGVLAAGQPNVVSGGIEDEPTAMALEELVGDEQNVAVDMGNSNGNWAFKNA